MQYHNENRHILNTFKSQLFSMFHPIFHTNRERIILFIKRKYMIRLANTMIVFQQEICLSKEQNYFGVLNFQNTSTFTHNKTFIPQNKVRRHEKLSTFLHFLLHVDCNKLWKPVECCRFLSSTMQWTHNEINSFGS